MRSFPAPLRLRLDSDALVSNWQWLAGQGGAAACGAAVKADGYGLGAREVVRRLTAVGCRDFFVSNWHEAEHLEPLLEQGINLSVLHGVREEDMAYALMSRAMPVLCSPIQIERWKAAGRGECHLMVDTGMSRLGVDWRSDVATLVEGLSVDTLFSHLASADEDSPLNESQLKRFAVIKNKVDARRYSLANSAGICLGRDYAFDLTRPGISLYGGIARERAAGHIRQVAFPQAQVLQCRRVVAGDTVGYNATFRAPADMDVAILNLGYADGYLRGFSGCGSVTVDGESLPLIGRVSMDLLAVDVTGQADICEGQWLDIDYDLPRAAAVSGLSQYELLTGLGNRFDRIWV